MTLTYFTIKGPQVLGSYIYFSNMILNYELAIFTGKVCCWVMETLCWTYRSWEQKHFYRSMYFTDLNHAPDET